jgi:hypothetical protein
MEKINWEETGRSNERRKVSCGQSTCWGLVEMLSVITRASGSIVVVRYGRAPPQTAVRGTD